MRGLYSLNRFRLTGPEIVRHFGNIGDDRAGMFEVPSKQDGTALRVLASADEGWDHVSVSCETRCPTWDEMEQIKRLFFLPGETAFQLHVAESEHISVHPYCLHIWRPRSREIPLPPQWMVA